MSSRTTVINQAQAKDTHGHVLGQSHRSTLQPCSRRVPHVATQFLKDVIKLLGQNLTDLELDSRIQLTTSQSIRLGLVMRSLETVLRKASHVNGQSPLIKSGSKSASSTTLQHSASFSSWLNVLAHVERLALILMIGWLIYQSFKSNHSLANISNSQSKHSFESQSPTHATETTLAPKSPPTNSSNHRKTEWFQNFPFIMAVVQFIFITNLALRAKRDKAEKPEERPRVKTRNETWARATINEIARESEAANNLLHSLDREAGPLPD